MIIWSIFKIIIASISPYWVFYFILILKMTLKENVKYLCLAKRDLNKLRSETVLCGNQICRKSTQINLAQELETMYFGMSIVWKRNYFCWILMVKSSGLILILIVPQFSEALTCWFVPFYLKRPLSWLPRDCQPLVSLLWSLFLPFLCWLLLCIHRLYLWPSFPSFSLMSNSPPRRLNGICRSVLFCC